MKPPARIYTWGSDVAPPPSGGGRIWSSSAREAECGAYFLWHAPQRRPLNAEWALGHLSRHRPEARLHPARLIALTYRL